MARKHAFFIVVLLTAAVLAGFAVLARSTGVAQPASATATPALSQSALEARLRELDRFEAKLRRQMVAKPEARNAGPATVIRRSTAAPAAASEEDEHADEDGDHEEDDD